MRPFETLTSAGQARRVRPAAAEALARFGLAGASLRLVQHEEATVYRVDAGTPQPDGPWLRNNFALRVHPVDYQSVHEVRSELTWLGALAAVGVPVPAPVPATDGSLVVVVDAPHARGPRPVSLLRWVRGRRMHDVPPTSRYRAVGTALAAVHRHAAGWGPPDGFTRLTWDWDGLFGDAITSAGTTAADTWAAVPRAQRSRWRRSAERFAAAVDDLGTGADVFSLIHGDFHHGNLLYGDGEIRPVDFNDCGWGWHLYDYAVALGRANRLGDRWEAVSRAFWDGYATRRAVPAPGVLRHLDAFLAARSVSVSLWAIAMTRVNPDFERWVPYTIEQTDALLDVIGHA